MPQTNAKTLGCAIDTARMHLEGLDLKFDILEEPNTLELVVEVKFRCATSFDMGSVQWMKDGRMLVDARHGHFSDYIDEGTLSLVQKLALVFLNH